MVEGQIDGPIGFDSTQKGVQLQALGGLESRH